MIDVALFGAGRIGNIHAGNVAREEGVRLKYVVDVNQEAAQKLAARHGALPQVGIRKRPQSRINPPKASA